MTKEEIYNDIKKMIVERLGVDESKISPETILREDLGADSLDVVELVMEIEDMYEFEISDEEAEKMKTIGDAVDYIDQNKEE